MENRKDCSICFVNKDLSEYYSQKRKDGTLYYHPECKLCTRKRSHKWALDNPEDMRKARIKHSRKEHVIIRDKENKKKYREKGGQSAWQRNHPEKVRQYNQQHRDHEISDAEWASCKKYFDDSCAYCGLHISEHFITYAGELKHTDLHKEHVDDDGANDLSNCIPSCQSCNSQKWMFSLDEWYNSSNARYAHERDDQILAWLNNDYKKFKDIEVITTPVEVKIIENYTGESEFWN